MPLKSYRKKYGILDNNLLPETTSPEKKRLRLSTDKLQTNTESQILSNASI